MYEIRLDEVSVGQLVPTVLSNLNARLWGRVHQAELRLDVRMLLVIIQIVPSSMLAE